MAFALQLRKKHGKTSVSVAEECHQNEVLIEKLILTYFF